MLTKNHIIATKKEEIQKNKEKMKLEFPNLFTKEELQTELDDKKKLKQHSEYLLKYIKEQHMEQNSGSDTKKKLETTLKELLK